MMKLKYTLENNLKFKKQIYFINKIYMSSNIKDNMYIGYIIMTLVGFSVFGLYVYKNNILIQDKKMEAGNDSEKQQLLTKEENNIQRPRRKILSDINNISEIYPKGCEYVSEKNDFIININDSKIENNCSMEITDLESNNNSQDPKDIESQNTPEEIKNIDEMNRIRDEFDWLVVD